MSEPMMTPAERESALALLGLDEGAAAPAPITEVEQAPISTPIVQATMVGENAALVVPEFAQAHFQDMPLDTPAECEAAYRFYFDKHKVHRRVSPGYNGLLTKSIRTAIRDERARRQGPKTGFVKNKVREQNAAKTDVEHVIPATVTPEQIQQMIDAAVAQALAGRTNQ